MFEVSNKIFSLLVDNVTEIVAVDNNFMEKSIKILSGEDEIYSGDVQV